MSLCQAPNRVVAPLRRYRTLLEYHTPETLIRDLEALRTNNPDILRLEEVGRSVENRPIWLCKVGKSDTNPGLFMEGGIHGNEAIGVEMAFLWVRGLIEGRDHPEVRELLEKTTLWAIPMLNPDGNVHNHRTNAHNIDLNRNHGCRVPQAPAECFCRCGCNTPSPGPHPFSEPETQAYRAAFERRKFTWSICYHSGTEVLAYPWGAFRETPPDEASFIDFCQRIEKHIKDRGFEPYKWGQIIFKEQFLKELYEPVEVAYPPYIIYCAGGATDDYVYSHATLDLILEVSYDYEPPPSQIAHYFERQISLPYIVHKSLITEAPGDFKLTLSPSSIGIAQGSSGVISVKVEKTNDYKERVTLSSRNLPTGVTISFNPSSGIPNFTSQATISVSSTAPPGNYTVLILGTGPNGLKLIKLPLSFGRS